MDTDVWILGGYQSDFARNLTKEGLDFADLTREIVDATLGAAKVNAGDIGVVHVANAFGEVFAEQGHLGAMPATPPLVISAPQHGRGMRGPTRSSSGRRCSPTSPTSTTAATDWTKPICGRSRSSTSPTRAETPTRRPENGLCPTRSVTTTRPT